MGRDRSWIYPPPPWGPQKRSFSMRLSSSGCVRGGQFVIDLSSAKKKGMEEGRRAEKMVSKESSSKVMDFSFLQSKATGFYQRSHLDNPKRPHSATSDFPQSLASWACRGVVGVGGAQGFPGGRNRNHAGAPCSQEPSRTSERPTAWQRLHGTQTGARVWGCGWAQPRGEREGWGRGLARESRQRAGLITGLCCPPAAVWLGWEMNTFFKRSEFCSFFGREQRCLPSGGAGLCSRSSPP